MANRVVTKVLAGIEDLLLGTGIVVQTRAGSSKTITKIDAAGLIYENAETLRTRFGKKVEVLTNIAALQVLATTTVAETFIYLLGYTTAGDGGGGLFWLDTTDTTTVEDLNIVFNPDILANGRWKRVDTDSYMSPDRGDADYTIQAFDFGIQQYSTALTVDRTVTLPSSGLYKGKRISVLRLAGGSFNLTIGSITTLVDTGLVELQYDGTSWLIISSPSSIASAISDTFNGSFETDNDNDNLPDNWAINEITAAVIEIDKIDQAHGINSLKFLSNGNGGGAATSERFDVLKGEILTVEFTYKSSVVDSLNKIEVQTYDKDGLAISLLPLYSESIANPIIYTTKSGTVTIDATAVTAEIIITGIDIASTDKAAGVTTHFDNIKYINSLYAPILYLPIIDEIHDISNNEIVIFKTITDAINELTVTNSAAAINNTESGSTIDFTSPNIIDDSANGFGSFSTGDKFRLIGSTSNDEIRIIDTVSAAQITTIEQDITTEVSSSASVITKLSVDSAIKHEATGDDTDIGINLIGKGIAPIYARGTALTHRDKGYGGRVLIETQTANADTSIDFETGIDSTYELYEIELINVVPVTDDAVILFRVGTGATPIYDTGANYEEQGSATNTTFITLTSGASNSVSNSGFNGKVVVSNPASASVMKTVRSKGSVRDTGFKWNDVDKGGGYVLSTAVTAFRFYLSAGTITVGEFRLYGVIV